MCFPSVSCSTSCSPGGVRSCGVSELEVLQNVIHGNAAPLGPNIPLPLRMIVEKALEKDVGIATSRCAIWSSIFGASRGGGRRIPDRWPRVPPRCDQSRGRGWALQRLLLSWPPSLESRLVAGGARRLHRRSPRLTCGFKRITDFVGIEDRPAVSPDGKLIAFVARLDGRRQIWVRLLAGGAALPITRDEADHEHPRWSHDSSAYRGHFVPPTTEGESGTLWEVSAFGGPPRRLAASTAGADVSHDGRRMATFQRTGQGIALAILGRDGAPSGDVYTDRGGVMVAWPRRGGRPMIARSRL